MLVSKIATIRESLEELTSRSADLGPSQSLAGAESQRCTRKNNQMNCMQSVRRYFSQQRKVPGHLSKHFASWGEGQASQKSSSKGAFFSFRADVHDCDWACISLSFLPRLWLQVKMNAKKGESHPVKHCMHHLQKGWMFFRYYKMSSDILRSKYKVLSVTTVPKWPTARAYLCLACRRASFASANRCPSPLLSNRECKALRNCSDRATSRWYSSSSCCVQQQNEDQQNWRRMMKVVITAPWLCLTLAHSISSRQKQIAFKLTLDTRVNVQVL